MNRRDFITLLGGGAAAWPLAARAQQSAMPVIGFLNSASPEAFRPNVAGFRQGLQEAGYVEGKNIAIDYRWAGGQYSKLPALAAELVSRKVSVIAATGGIASARSAKKATASIPIVFVTGNDPVNADLVPNFNRPGGNVTGVAFLVNTLGAKRLELLREVIPGATTIGMLVNPTNPDVEPETKDMRAAAGAIGRELIVVNAATAAVTWPLSVRAQQPNRIAQIGYLSQESVAFDRSHGDSAAFRDGLHDLGYIEGKNLHIEFRYAEADLGRLPALAAELVSLNVNIVVTYSAGTFAAQRVTTTIPIVQVVGSDLVAMGSAASLAQPGGNVTGSTFFIPELMAKRLELLKELLPSMRRAGLLMVRNNPSTLGILEAMGSTAQALDVAIQPIEVGEPSEFDSALSAWVDQQAGGFIMHDHGFLLANVDSIATLAARHRLPSIGPLELPASGGLFGYGVKFSDFFRRAGYFVDKILKGTKPGDIPIEQAIKFKSVVNLKAAKTLDINMPTSILLRADEVIE